VQGVMRQSGYVFCVLMQLGITSAFADQMREDDADWLKIMSFAARKTDYCGVFFYQSGGSIEMSRITHVSDEAGEHERLEELGGRRSELIRNNDQVFLFVDGRKVRVEKRPTRRAFPALLPEQISTLKENYLVGREEEDEVAGYPVRAVVFQPRDNLRYTRKMWAHDDTGLLLRAAVIDDRGYIIEQYSFMQLNISVNIDRKWITQDKALHAELSQQIPSSQLHKEEAILESNGWQVDALPSGFKKILEMRRSFRENKDPAIHMVFSDGLSGISVFIEKADEPAPHNSGLSGEGAMHVYNRTVGEHLVTVVGEVPARTVIQVGDSVRYAGQ
jgi:sigma-E factor negative regulatory protein RseB